MKFVSIPTEIEAEQFTGHGRVPGMCDGKGPCIGTIAANTPHVHTIHREQVCFVTPGDWVIMEPDGVHAYPCQDEIFRRKYRPGELKGDPIDRL